jgi:hypothetical protein
MRGLTLRPHLQIALHRPIPSSSGLSRVRRGYRNGVQRERLEELIFVGSDTAVVIFCITLTGDERAPERLIRSRRILIVTRRDDGWKIGWGKTRVSQTLLLMQPLTFPKPSAESNSGRLLRKASAPSGKRGSHTKPSGRELGVRGIGTSETS